MWTFDPRTKDKSLPFITWPCQDNAFLTILHCIEEGKDLVIEKSRDMGASWMSLTAMEWLWHYKKNMTFLAVSRNEKLVDSPGNPDSLFWKIDFIHRHLPEWLLPRDSFERTRLHFGNNRTHSTIDGESTTAAAGVGGRRTAMFIDEFSRIEEGYQLLSGTADTTRCRIFNFTPLGTGNAAYKLAQRTTDIIKLRLHWSDHPLKAAGLYKYNSKTKAVEVLDKDYEFADDFNFIQDGKLRSPWYDAECQRRANERDVAENLDIDYQGSQYEFFDKSMLVNLQDTYCIDPLWEGEVSYDPDTAEFRELVKVAGGPLKLWVNLDAHNKPPPITAAGGADISWGSGATPSCLSFINCATGEKFAEYANSFLTPDTFAKIAFALCHLFKNEHGTTVKFAWEHQGPGQPFGKKLMELGYRNVFFRQAQTGIPGYEKGKDVPGWIPTPDNKRTVLTEYRTALSTRQFINRSWKALEECRPFIHINGYVEHAGALAGVDERGNKDPTAARENHGDRVVADALAWMMCGGVRPQLKKAEAEAAPVGSLAWRRLLAHNERQKEKDSWD